MIKEKDIIHNKCKKWATCKYGMTTKWRYKTYAICGYSLATRDVRGCSVECCDKYEPKEN